MTYKPSWSSGAAVLDPGTVVPFARTLPAGFLACDGTAVSRTTYAALFAVISTVFGVGDGSTTFNVPNMNRRAPVGSGGSGTATLGNALGNSGGAETHTLSTAEMPSHTHQEQGNGDVPLHQAPGGASTSTTIEGLANPGSNPGPDPALNTVATGGGGAHNNIQPSLILNYGIKT